MDIEITVVLCLCDGVELNGLLLSIVDILVLITH